MALSLAELTRAQEDRVVAPTRELEIERAILDAVDGRRSTGEIASLLAERFPEPFSDEAEARARVTRVLDRYPKR
jgi:hypothetical protein